MAQIKSKFNEIVAFLANVGIVGKTKTVKFQPRAKGKTFVNRPCAQKGCGYKMGIVFQGFEDKSLFLVWCPKCNTISWPKPTVPGKVEEDGTCVAIKKDGTRCTNKAKDGHLCGVHSKQVDDACKGAMKNVARKIEESI